MKQKTAFAIAGLLLGPGSCASQAASVPAAANEIEIVVPAGVQGTGSSGTSGLPTPHFQGGGGGSVSRFGWGDTGVGWPNSGSRAHKTV